MTNSSYFLQDGPTKDKRWLLSEWLPSRSQMQKAIRLRFDTPPNVTDEDIVISSDSVLYASMRQGMGMIIAAGLLAGLLPFVWNWFTAERNGTVIALANMGKAAQALPGASAFGADSLMVDALQTMAGLEPAVFPGWMAAGISSLGVWLNVPLQWLTVWIVYGLLVLLIAKLLGAPTTLQQFYTLTSFGFLPLILTGLGLIPCLGTVVWIAAVIWAIAVYSAGVRSATRLSTGLSLLCTILPGAIVVLLSVLVAVATAATVVGVLI